MKGEKNFAFCSKMGFMINKTRCDECFMKGKASCELRGEIVFNEEYSADKISEDIKNIFVMIEKKDAEIQEKIKVIKENADQKEEGTDKKRHN